MLYELGNRGEGIVTLTWIWLGAVVMVVGGAVSLTDRRLRVGAPARSKRRSGLVDPTPQEA